jgi:glycosyltransferase involved in cell wall biosynthesis
MKILYFSRGYTSHDHRFLSAISEAGHATYFLREINRNSDLRPLPDGVRPVKGGLKQIIQALQPDLVHAGPLRGPAYRAARSGFRPLVLMSWGSDILWDGKRNLFASLRISKALKRADAVIGDCSAVRQAIISRGIEDDRIVTFPWGLDLKRFSPGNGGSDLRTSLGWQKAFVLLHVRSWEPLYDPLTVARAFVTAAWGNSSLRLLMPGSGRLKSKLIRIFEKAGVRNRVHFPGSVSQEDLPEYYRTADLYVSASLSDGSSVSLMEAMASGLTSLVSDIPGNREWIRPDKEGWLFPARDAAKLAALILEAAENAQLKNLAASARQVAEERADWPRNKQRLFKAYDIAMEAVR